jgi:hypothetical protein
MRDEGAGHAGRALLIAMGLRVVGPSLISISASLVNPLAQTGDRRCEGGHDGARKTHHQHARNYYQDKVN